MRATTISPLATMKFALRTLISNIGETPVNVKKRTFKTAYQGESGDQGR
jgi:hypothetical protein